MPWLRVSGTMNFLQGRWIFFNFLSIKQQPRIKFCKKCIASTSTPGVFLFPWLKSSQHFNVRSVLLQRCGPTLCWSEVGNEKIIWRWILNAAQSWYNFSVGRWNQLWNNFTQCPSRHTTSWRRCNLIVFTSTISQCCNNVAKKKRRLKDVYTTSLYCC